MRLKLSALLAVLLSFSASASAASLTPLGDLPGGGSLAEANGVSGDGSVVVGWSNSASGQRGVPLDERRRHGRPGRPARRRVSSAYASGVSADGSVVVGQRHLRLRPRGLPLDERRRHGRTGHLPGGGSDSAAVGVSADGSVVVGSSSTPTSAARGLPLDERRRHGRPGRPARRLVQ